MKWLLVVEDDRRLAGTLQRGLEEEGYVVDTCHDGEDALRRAGTSMYDGIILDVLLPGRNGFDVCRELRDTGVATPILMLTAKDTVDDTVAGLGAGADDYLRKPFAFRELRARLNAMLRRRTEIAPPIIEAGGIVLDIARREVTRNRERVTLTNREYQILACLMRNRDRAVSRTIIEARVWGHVYGSSSNAVDVHIRRLRRKLDLPGRPSVIQTVRGTGYRFASTR